MDLAQAHIYLLFDIYRFGQKLSEVKILIHKENDIEKWKNPQLEEGAAIEFFKLQNPIYKEASLTAYYTGDLIPKL